MFLQLFLLARLYLLKRMSVCQYHNFFNQNYMAIVRYPKQFHHLPLQTMWSCQRSSKLLSSHPELGGWGGGNGSSSDRWGLEVPKDDIKRTKRAGLAIAAPRPPPLLRSAERAVVSSCWEEVILALEVRYRERATSGQHWEVGQDARRPGVTVGGGKTRS